MSCGLLIITLLLLSFLKDWDDNPIQTNIESVAIPVAPLPFPTVTVCPDKIPVNNWAFPQKVVNLYLFECEFKVTSNLSDYQTCEGADAIRLQFKDFFRMIAKMQVDVSVGTVSLLA